MTYKGLTTLKKAGYDIGHNYKIKINLNQIDHDLIITDLLIYFLQKKGITEYKTDFVIRREMYKERGQKRLYRIPDLIVKEPAGMALIEFENTPRQKTRILKDIKDYLAYYPRFEAGQTTKNYYRVYFIVKAGRVNFYHKLAEQGNLRKYTIATFDIEQGNRDSLPKYTFKEHYKR